MSHRRLSILFVVALSVAFAVVGVSPSLAGSPPKQNGSSSTFDAFTPICAVGGYASYGNCGGDVTTYTNVTGRMNAVQANEGRYNLGFTFTNLTPGAVYRLWGKYCTSGFFAIDILAADSYGVARFSYQTSTPEGLGFDLNIVAGDITVVTS